MISASFGRLKTSLSTRRNRSSAPGSVSTRATAVEMYRFGAENDAKAPKIRPEQAKIADNLT
jgi:hypothetical protein